jgi:hypothetical protein
VNGRFFLGATTKATTAVHIELDDGSHLPAQLVACDAAPWDLCVIPLDVSRRPVARLRFTGSNDTPERIPFATSL